MRARIIPGLLHAGRPAYTHRAARPAARDLPGVALHRKRAWRSVGSIRLGLLPGLAGYGLVVTPPGGEGGLPCLWRLLLAVPCPGCGLSRANALLVRGSFHEAFAMNALVVPLWLIASWTCVAALLTLTREVHHG